MEVETYEVEEKDGTDAAPTVEADALALIDSLGLKGQKKLVVGDGDKRVRVPYREMTRQEQVVYTEIFPSHTAIENYEAGPIPLRVLQVAAHAKTFFPCVQVWHREVMDKDPLLVGRKDQWSNPVFMLARWGDALRRFEDLMTEARSVLEVKWRNALNETELKITAFRSNIQDHLSLKLAGKDVYLP